MLHAPRPVRTHTPSQLYTHLQRLAKRLEPFSLTISLTLLLSHLLMGDVWEYGVAYVFGSRLVEIPLHAANHERNRPFWIMIFMGLGIHTCRVVVVYLGDRSVGGGVDTC